MRQVIAVEEGARVMVFPEGMKWLVVPDDTGERCEALKDYCRQHTDLAATCEVTRTDIARLALLRGLAQLEADAELAAAGVNAVMREGF